MLPQATITQPVVTVRRGPHATAATPTDRQHGGHYVQAIMDDIISFQAVDGESITYQALKHATDEALRAILLGTALATILRQRGYLALHACAVAQDGRALAFVGRSGGGKSTLAELFSQRGYDVLNDDVLAIDFSEGHPHVLPGYTQIKLRPEAGRHLLPDYDALPRIDDERDRRVFTNRASAVDSPVPLRRIYLLDSFDAESSGIDEVSQRDYLLEISHHTRSTELLFHPSYRAAHFRQCSELVEKVPAARLRRTRNLNDLNSLFEAIERDFHSEPSAPLIV